MKIIFTHHYKKRKTERDDYFLPSVKYAQTANSIPSTERILRRKGKWYGRMDEEEGLYKLFCIVNNLEVYCGIIIDDDERAIYPITTYWPYTSKMKRKPLPPRKTEFYLLQCECTFRSSNPIN